MLLYRLDGTVVNRKKKRVRVCFLKRFLYLFKPHKVSDVGERGFQVLRIRLIGFAIQSIKIVKTSLG